MSFHSFRPSLILTSMFLRALSHSFCPGPDVEQRSRRLLMASVTALAAAASWFMTLGALGSAERALAARSSLLEETEMVRRYPSISLRLSRSCGRVRFECESCMPEFE